MPIRRLQLDSLFAPHGSGPREAAGARADGPLARCLEACGALGTRSWGIALLDAGPRREAALGALGERRVRLEDDWLALPWIASDAAHRPAARGGDALPGAWSFALAAGAHGLAVRWEPTEPSQARTLERALRLPGPPLAVLGLSPSPSPVPV